MTSALEATFSLQLQALGAGFAADCEKYNLATLMGWRVLRFTGQMIEDWSAVDAVALALKSFGGG